MSADFKTTAEYQESLEFLKGYTYLIKPLGTRKQHIQDIQIVILEADIREDSDDLFTDKFANSLKVIQNSPHDVVVRRREPTEEEFDPAFPDAMSYVFKNVNLTILADAGITFAGAKDHRSEPVKDDKKDDKAAARADRILRKKGWLPPDFGGSGGGRRQT